MMPIIPIPMVTDEIIIGPNSCSYCGGEYGFHASDCHRPKTKSTNNMELAKIAYEAYCAVRNWKSVKGETLPHFHQQDPALQEAWASAAAAVKNHIGRAISPG